MKRRKRSRSFNEGEKKSKGMKVYEYYESKRTRSKKPSHHDLTTTVYTTKTVNGRDKEPKYREKLVYTEPDEHKASELEDLANDQYFYEQLEKNRPPTESSVEVEQVHELRPNVNRDVVFLQGSGKKRGRNRQKLAHIYKRPAHIGAIIDEDEYGDYGEMVFPHRDVEMHDTFEKNTHESHVHAPAQYSHDGSTGLRKRRPKCNLCTPSKQSARLQYGNNSYNQQKSVYVHRPKNKKHFERIMVTKKLNGADELHAEIDKIFQMKNQNYNKPGHSKAHWELRIMPQRYEELEEYPTN